MEHTFNKKFRRIISLILVIMMIVPFTVFELGTTSSAGSSTCAIEYNNSYWQIWGEQYGADGRSYKDWGGSVNRHDVAAANSQLSITPKLITWPNAGNFILNPSFVAETVGTIKPGGMSITFRYSGLSCNTVANVGLNESNVIWQCGGLVIGLLPEVGNPVINMSGNVYYPDYAEGKINCLKGIRNDELYFVFRVNYDMNTGSETVNKYRYCLIYQNGSFLGFVPCPIAQNTDYTVRLVRTGSNTYSAYCGSTLLKSNITLSDTSNYRYVAARFSSYTDHQDNLTIKKIGSCSSSDNDPTTFSGGGHNFGDWTVTKVATCTQKGSKTRTCTCGYSETQEIAMLSHSNSWVTGSSYDLYKCSSCDTISRKRITVDYNANGGSVSGASQTIEFSASSESDSTTVTPSVTVTPPTGKQLAGWSTSPTGSPSASVSLSENATLYAIYTDKAYTITLNPNGGTMMGETVYDASYGQTYTQIFGSFPTATKTGYKLDYWDWDGGDFNLSSGGMGNTYSVDGNSSFTAHWSPITYTVAYNANGGTGTMSSDSGIEYTTAYIVKNNTFTAPAGMEFDSWNTQADGKGTKYDAGSQYSNLTATDGATVTLYAQWKKSGTTVTLNSGNYGNGDSYQIVVPDGETVTLVGANNAVFNATGYGNANKSNREATKQAISSAYGGIGVDSTKPVVKTDKYISENYAQLTWGNTAWFIGWNTKADGSGEWLTTLDGTVTTVCAVWGWPVVWNTSGIPLSSDYDIQKSGNTPSKVITWTYVSDLDTKALTHDGKTYNYGQSFNTVFGQPYPGSLQREGYVADGGNTPFWLCYKAKTFTTEGAEQYLTPYGVYAMELEDAYHTDENGMLEFVAIWKPKIVYKANGGTGSDIVEVLARVGEPAGATEEQTFAGGIFNPSFSDYYAKSSDTFSRTGYNLVGWSTNSSAASPEYACGAKIWSAGYATEDNFKPLTLYAVWEKGSYTVTLTLNGGTVNQGNVTSYTYGTGATLPTDVTRTGYTFGGWYDNSSFTGDRIYSIASNATGNKTYYAKWTVNTYTVTYHANNGTDQTTTGTKTYGTPYTVIECPFAYSGYVFNGWNTASDGSGTAYTVNAQYTENAPIDLYAQWKKLNLTVSGAASDDIRITYYDADGNLITKDNAPGEETAYNAKIASAISLEYTKQDLFYCWVNESGKVLSTDRAFTYTMYTPMEIRVCHDSKDDGQNYGLVVFLSYDDQVISANAYTSDAFTEDIYNSVSKPTRLGYSFNGWDKTVDEIKTEIGTASGSVVVKATYTENAEQYSVRYTYAYTETNSKSEEFSYSLGESSYRAANKVTGSYYFDRWEIRDGNDYRVFSYNPGVALRRMTNDTVELVARYVDSEESLSPKQAVVNKPLAYSSYDSSAQKKKAQFVVEYALPENYVIAEMGILYSTKAANGTADTLKLADDNSLPGGIYKYTSAKSGDSAVLFGTITLTLNIKSTVQSGMVYARGYIIYKTEGSAQTQIAYSSNVSSVDVGAISTN